MSATNPDNTLTSTEVAHLNELEAVVRRGLETDLELGNALAQISDASLYRATHPTFEAYLRDRWNIRQAPDHQLSRAAAIADRVSDGLELPTPETAPGPALGPRSDPEGAEVLGRMGWLLTQATGAVADVTHHLETRAADLDDDARVRLGEDLLALHDELDTLKALLEPVAWDAGLGRLLAGEVPPLEDDADDE